MSEPILVLCMAGRYSRFRQAGYTTPKFLLPVDKAGRQTILGWITDELAPTRVVCVTNTRDDVHLGEVERILSAGGAREVAVRSTGDTEGQAATAILGAEVVVQQGWNGPILFHNIDTVLLGRDLAAMGARLASCDGLIDVFAHDAPIYSYCAVDGDRVTAIAEKVVIGPWATSGLYGFSSAGIYLRHAAATAHRSGGEFYISDVYRTMLDAGCDLRVSPASLADTLVLGTPAEYEAWFAEHAR